MKIGQFVFNGIIFLPHFLEENHCKPVNPCENDGLCIETEDSYKCHCKIGYNGYNCEGKKYFIVHRFTIPLSTSWYVPLQPESSIFEFFFLFKSLNSFGSRNIVALSYEQQKTYEMDSGKGESRIVKRNIDYFVERNMSFLNRKAVL